ncbi:D-alanyl-D-alanine carboxypeptidase [Streptomyces aureoverticillatus]|nr:D-alanyl-D-alanine carboxypeptidase [Streptomyces aureoverticillatus]
MAGEFPDRSKTVSGGGASDGGADASSSPASGSTSGSTLGDTQGDARLRAAVAAWVAGSEESPGAEGAEGADGADGSVGAEGEGSSSGVGGASGEGSESPERSGEASDDGTAEAADGGDEGAADGDISAGQGGAADTGADGDAEGSADGGGDGDDGAEDGAEDSAAADGDEGAEDDGAAASGSAVDMATAVFTAARPSAKADDAEADDARADDEVRSESGSESESGSDDAESESESGSPDPRIDQATAVFRTVRPGADAKSGEDAPKGAAKSGEDASKDEAEPGDDAPKEDAESRSGERGVDQATAVFKAVRPASAGVDQPTTMLKLGDAGKSEEAAGAGAAKKAEPKAESKAKETPKAANKAAPKAAPESESERTSKFVALKPLDEPRAKPAPKPATDPAGKPGAKPGAAGTGAAGAGAAAAGAGADAKAGSTSVPAQSTPGQAPPPGQAPQPDQHTRQQPLPPKPPIDLLAELTNTPPPAETPVRTIVRRVKIWTPLVLLLAVVFAVAQAVRPLPDPKLTLTSASSYSFEGGKPSIPWPSKGQAAMDVDGIGSFGTSGAQKPVPIASIAKVMTTYLILRDHPIKKGGDGKTLTVDAEAQRHYEKGKPENESVVKVTEGQKITQYEALQAVMLPSANNVARMLARWDSNGDEKKFVAKMNKTAKELGMKNTRYTDPSGLDKTTVSTAEDLVKLGRVAMENPTFKEIARQPGYKDLNNEEQKNYFGLVPTVAIGIKTGTTTAAGGNILFAAEKKVGGKTHVIVGAALAQFGSGGVANIDKVTNVTKDLIAAGQDALQAKTVVKKGQVVGEVDDGLGGTTPVVATKDVTAVGWSGLTAKVELDDAGKTPPHSAKAGTVVGRLTVGDGTTSGAIKVPVALQKDLSEPGFGAKLTRVA